MVGMSKRMKRRREIERLFALRDRQGLTLRELADRSGIPVGTLSWWSYRLRAEESAGFTEVRLSPGGAVTDEAGEARSVVRLHMPAGLIAEFEGDVADRAATSLIESLVRWS